MEPDPLQPGFNPFGVLPPEVAVKIDAIISKMVKKVEPEIQEISKILNEHKSAGLKIYIGVQPKPPSNTDKSIVSPYYYPLN